MEPSYHQDGVETQKIVALLAESSLMQSLNEIQLEHVARSFRIRTYLAEQTVITQDEESADVYCLARGSVRATLFSPSGREISYQELSVGDFFGELSAIDGAPRSTHVITNEASRFLVLSKSKFLELLQQYPQMGTAVLQKMAGLVRFLCDRVYEYSALDVNCRVRSELIRIAQTKGVPVDGGILIDPMPTHQELASRIATHREAVTRELNRMAKSEGIIVRKGKGVLVPDLNVLKALVP
ncbi:Crp/Fnr family transcriptional regulator [Teredinibacter purpureus]|uniref:Crp/Fnr family transcriptional regulator n=1 Tax=Teredinibacter purpureus TaxID=2731756 RepID=UPI0006990A8F|nr:Crp/Fnr family transcriptional regulator [Teredinibacter purpureus]